MSKKPKNGYLRPYSSDSENIEAIVKSGNYKVNIESINIEDPKDARVRRFKDLSLFIVALALVSAIAIFCLYIVIFSKSYSADANKWATTILGATIASLITHLVDKKSK